MPFNEQIRELTGDREAQAALVLEEAARSRALYAVPNEVQDIVVDSAQHFMNRLEAGAIDLLDDPRAYLRTTVNNKVRDTFRNRRRPSQTFLKLETDIDGKMLAGASSNNGEPESWAKEHEMKSSGTAFDESELFYLKKAIDKIPENNRNQIHDYKKLAKLLVLNDPAKFYESSLDEHHGKKFVFKNNLTRTYVLLLEALEEVKSDYGKQKKPAEEEAVQDLITKVGSVRALGRQHS